MAALILRPPRGPPPPAPPRPRATPGGTSAGPPPPPAPIGRPRRRSATVRASPAGAPEPHFRDGAWQAGAARPRPGAGGRPHESQSAGCGAGLRAGPGELSSSLPDRETEARLGGDPAAKVTPQARRLGSSRTARTRKPGSEQTPNEATSLVAKLRSVHGSKTRLSSHSCKAENRPISSLLRVPGTTSGLPSLLFNFFVVVIVDDDGGIIVLIVIKFKTLTSLEFSGIKYIYVVVLR